MSKIFDMLSRSKGELADALRPIVQVPEQTAPPAPDAVTAPPPGDEIPVAQVTPVRSLGFRLPAPSPLLPFQKDQWRPSEQYRILRTKIVQHPKRPSVILVSSPSSGDGKSVTAINTAGALSLKSEGNVLLMDADLRRSAIHHLLGFPQDPGLGEVVKGSSRLDDALIHSKDFPNLYVLTAGAVTDSPSELLDSAAWQALCHKLRGLFRYIVVDSPPVEAVADYDLIQANCDGVIVVVRPDHTDRRLLQRALDAIPKAKFLGVLLNCVPEWNAARRAGGDYYYYSGKSPYERPKEQV